MINIEPVEGFEPTTPRLQITCSGQLSYTGFCIFPYAKSSIFYYPFARCKYTTNFYIYNTYITFFQKKLLTALFLFFCLYK